MTTLVTPSVFFREPTEVDPNQDDVGTLQSTVPSLTSDVGLIGGVADAQFTTNLQNLDREISDRFESATFVSSSV